MRAPESRFQVDLPPAGNFRCRLDEQPTFLVPTRLCRAPSVERQRLWVNSNWWWPGFAPVPVLPAHPDSLLGQDEPVWVRGLAGMWQPFSVGRRFRQILASLHPRTGIPFDLDVYTIQVLCLAGILIDREVELTYKTERANVLAESARNYAAAGYTRFSELLHPFHLGALRRYFRYRVRSNVFQSGDSQVPLRYVAHNEPVARFFHLQLTGLISAIVGERLKPSYVYFASYRAGAELPRHVDRQQCSHSVTMLVDYTPEPELSSPWPLHLDTPSGHVTVFQAIGEGLIYRGQLLPHFRLPLFRDAMSTSLFFHYVPLDFRGPLD
jgi:hypothetical protein